MRILIAEDDISQAESIQLWLEMDGYSIDWVQRGDHALQAIVTHDYDCILLDRGLPYLSGDEVMQAIRKKGKNTPILLITARDSIEDRVAGLDLGANDYLVKPFSLDELSARIRVQLRLQAKQLGQYLQWSNLKLDLQKKYVLVDEQPCELT
ncbi:MAG: response regulator, partial [Acinetobacter sp.]